MLSLLLGFGTIALGAKGFSREGLPLTSSKRITGAPAMVIGVFCLLLGVVFLADGAYSVYRITRPH